MKMVQNLQQKSHYMAYMAKQTGKIINREQGDEKEIFGNRITGRIILKSWASDTVIVEIYHNGIPISASYSSCSIQFVAGYEWIADFNPEWKCLYILVHLYKRNETRCFKCLLSPNRWPRPWLPSPAKRSLEIKLSWEKLNSWRFWNPGCFHLSLISDLMMVVYVS